MVCRRDVVLGSGVVRDAVGQMAPQFLREGLTLLPGHPSERNGPGWPRARQSLPSFVNNCFSIQGIRDTGCSRPWLEPQGNPRPLSPHPKTSSRGSWPSALGLSALDPTSFPGDANKRRENVVEGRGDGVKEKQEERGPPANTAETSPSLSPLSFRVFVH